MTNQFVINNSCLAYRILDFPLLVKSFPEPYQVSIVNSINEYQALVAESDFIIIDAKVSKLYMPYCIHNSCQTFYVVATEEAKSMDTVLQIINSFIDGNISKGSKVTAIGGGVVQDLAACACALFRRGQPFTYLPSTTLGQLDSCVGAKCAINTAKAKNIIGLFSAPRDVVIPTFMIKTMPLNEHRAGLSEMLRLCMTASWDAVNFYIRTLPSISNPSSIDLDIYVNALSVSLSIKKTVVDHDEYERDVRRSMNYGHTFGHAVEKLSGYSIPHGLAVLLGMLMANSFSLLNGFMTQDTYLRLNEAIRMTLADVNLNIDTIRRLDAQEIIDQFRFDKKGDGNSVPLILIKSPGDMMFYPYRFDGPSDYLVRSIEISLHEFAIWMTN